MKMWEWRYRSTHSKPGHKFHVTHTSKNLRWPFSRHLGGAQTWSGFCGRERKSLVPTGICTHWGLRYIKGIPTAQPLSTLSEWRCGNWSCLSPGKYGKGLRVGCGLHMCGYIKLDFSTATTHDVANATSKRVTANKCDTVVIKVCWYLTKLRHYIKLICVILPY